MKKLPRPPRAVTRRKLPAPIPRNYLIVELPANDMPSPTGNIIDIDPEHIRTDHKENRSQPMQPLPARHPR